MFASRAVNASASSSAPMGVARTARIGPWSSCSSIFMIVTPVSSSPARMARATGAAPRHRGSSDAWTLIAPSFGMSSTDRGTICP